MTAEFNFFVYLPIFFLLALLALERMKFASRSYAVSRDLGILGLYGLGWLVKLGLATYLLIPYLELLFPAQVFSLSGWAIPLWINATVCFLTIDLIQYWNHRLHHVIAPLWRLHRLHHSDKQMDTLTNWRHHPLEYLTGWVFVTGIFILFDLPMIVMVIYGLAAGIISALSHSRFTLPTSVSKIIEWIFVTPNAHRLHHSLDYKESNSNFGTIFLFWDRIFRTYISKEKSAIDSLKLGVDSSQAPKKENLLQYLLNPSRIKRV